MHAYQKGSLIIYKCTTFSRDFEGTTDPHWAGMHISKFEKKTGIGYRAALEGTIYLITLIITDQYQTVQA